MQGFRETFILVLCFYPLTGGEPTCVLFFFLSDSLMNIYNGAFKLYFMVTPLITPWKRKHTQALIMQQDCIWIVVQLIWYRVIPPCWCTSPVWIPFGSPAPKLDLHSPQGASVLINVAGPNIQELLCLTLHLHFVHPPFFCLHRNLCAPSDFLCAHTASKSVTCLMLALNMWRPLISVKRERLWRVLSHMRKEIAACRASKTARRVWTNATRIWQTCTGTWDRFGTKTFSKKASVWRTKIGKRNSGRLFGFLSWLRWFIPSLWANQDLSI